MISNWEANIRQMQSDYSETVSDEMQTTLLMMMSPQEAIDHAGASIENMNYNTFKERVLKFCADRCTTRDGAPMDISYAQANNKTTTNNW